MGLILVFVVAAMCIASFYLGYKYAGGDDGN